MSISFVGRCSAAARDKLVIGHTKVFERFGPPATGKTTEARCLAKQLDDGGFDVVVLDDLERGFEGGVQVYARKRSRS